jgi:RNA recognition motif-containing protein
MGTRLYVGNLPYAVTELDLRDLFGGVGTVTDAKIVTDRETGRPRGFGFVEMSTEDEARKAIEEMNGRDVQGRQVAVKEAEDRRGGGGWWWRRPGWRRLRRRRWRRWLRAGWRRWPRWPGWRRRRRTRPLVSQSDPLCPSSGEG